MPALFLPSSLRFSQQTPRPGLTTAAIPAVAVAAVAVAVAAAAALLLFSDAFVLAGGLISFRQTLNMSSNSLKLLPSAINTLTKLKTLRLDANKLEVRVRGLETLGSLLVVQTL